MAKSMAAGAFGETQTLNRCPDGFLNGGFINMMALHPATSGVFRQTAGRKYVLPLPLSGRAGVLSLNCPGQINPTASLAKVFLMRKLHPPQMLAQWRNYALGQNCVPVFGPFSISDRDLFHPKINVLHPQPQSFQQPQAASIEQ